MANIELKAPEGANKSKTQKGRGTGTGKGKTCGKGHKGQNSRSGGGVRPGFEGGQMPLYRRIARRGFSNSKFKVEYEVVNLDQLNAKYKNNEIVNLDTLKKKKLIKNSVRLVKILGNGNLEKKLKVEIPQISASAKLQIESAGGQVVLDKKSE